MAKLSHVLICCLASAPAGAALATEKPAGPSFALRLVDGGVITGPLESLTPEWSLRLGGGPSLLESREWYSLRRTGVVLPPLPTGEHVVLANGDRVAGEAARINEDRLSIRHCLGGDQELFIPLSALAAIWIQAPRTTDEVERMPRRLAAERRKNDMILLRNGDVVEGILLGLDRAKGVRLKAGKRELDFDFSSINVVALSTELMRLPRPSQVYGHLVLRDGTRLGLAAATSDHIALEARTLFGKNIKVPLDQVLALDLYQGPALYLSDVEPREYKFTPFLGTIRWPYRNDTSVCGRELVLADGVHDKGVGLHSACRLTYELLGKYRYFEALVGLDGYSGRTGCARIDVLVDGKSRLRSGKELTSQMEPKWIREDVQGAKTLTLVVDFGSYADIQGHVDWAEARLIR